MIETEQIPLTGGTWRPVRGVLRWVPAPVVRVVQPIACHCGARADESCKTKSGERIKAHRGRRIPRRCSCGAPVKPKCRLCPACKVEAGRRQSAEWTERRRAA